MAAKVPMTCTGVKCMIVGCRELASHKIGEENIWDRTEEKKEHEQFEQSHNLTTYVCDDHFRKIMTREVEYNTIKDEVTHTVFFGENIKRVLNLFKNKNHGNV